MKFIFYKGYNNPINLESTNENTKYLIIKGEEIINTMDILLESLLYIFEKRF